MISRFFGRLVKSTATWLEYDGGVYSAALAYYAASAFFPMLLLFNSFFHLSEGHHSFLGAWQTPMFETLEKEYSVEFRIALETAIRSTKDSHFRFSIIGIVWLLLSLLLVFAQLDRGFSRLWSREQVSSNNLVNQVLVLVKSRTRAFLLLVCFISVFFTLFVFSLTFDALGRLLVDSDALGQRFRWESHLIIHVALHIVSFAMLFKWLTPMSVLWSEAIHSAVLLSIAWEAGRQLVAAITFRNHQPFYNMAGGFVLILFWVYFASSVVFWSAAYLRILTAERIEATKNRPDR